jgi:predicted dinucleotide-binding enzyme
MARVTRRFRWLTLAVAGLSFLLASAMMQKVSAETVAVIGTGRVGSALGPRFAALDYKVVYGSRNPSSDDVVALVARTGGEAAAATQQDAAIQAEIIVLAIPWSATGQVVKDLGDLDGKIIIDVTNAIEFVKGGQMQMAVDTSAGELVQSWAPGASVVKAFNTISFTVMANTDAAGGPVTVPIAGNDEEAKQKIAGIIQAMGFETMDVGPIRNARVLESMTIIYMVPYLRGRREDTFEFYFRRLPQ